MDTDIVSLCEKFPAAPRYLSQVYLLLRENEPVVGVRISERLGVTPSSVTQTLKRLEQRGLLQREPSRGYTLTDSGMRLAKHYISRHYLLERLLVDELGVAWDVADDEAERLQMVLSTTLEHHIAKRLGHPDTCPHGNPFPGSEREAYLLHAPTLTDADAGDRVRVIRVTEEGEAVDGLLRFCYEQRLMLGSVLTVGAHSATVLRARFGDDDIDIPLDFARHIRVEPAT